MCRGGTPLNEAGSAGFPDQAPLIAREFEPAGRKATLERLKYAARRGKVKRLSRGTYASRPPGVNPAHFQPDRFLSAVALRPDAVSSHHSALELSGAAHSEWRLCTAYSDRRARPFKLNGAELRFLSHPKPLAARQLTRLGTRFVHRLDRELRVTGPERTLIDGFSRDRWRFQAGGLQCTTAARPENGEG